MLRGATSQHTDTSYQWVWSNHPIAPVVPPSARSAQGGTRRQTTARGHRGLLPAENARQRAMLLTSTSQLPHQQAHCAAV